MSKATSPSGLAGRIGLLLGPATCLLILLSPAPGARSVTGWRTAAVPFWILITAATTLSVFLTEITSNAATATMAMPIMAGAAAALDQPAIALMAAAGLSASMAFMLPVATPPNAIVFSSGYLTIPQMVRAGIAMNLVSIVVITIAGVFLIPMVLM